jgi:hypothetical protein
VTLYHVDVTETVVRDLSGCSHIVKLRCLGCRFSEAAQASMRECVWIHDIEIVPQKSATEEVNVDLLKDMPGLEAIAIEYGTVHLDQLEGLSCRGRLRALSLRGANMVGRLRSVEGFERLEFLSLHNAMQVKDRGMCMTKDNKLENLTALHNLRQLRLLDLTGLSITEAEIAELQRCLPRCRILYGDAIVRGSQ